MAAVQVVAAMPDSLPLRRGGRLLLFGNAVAQGCALVRYTLLARLLGPEQLGLAATLILTAQFFDSISESGSDRFLIQDAEGDDPRAQALVHLLAIVRGIVIAGALALLAAPIAHFYHEAGLSMGLIGLAAVPLITGLFHFDLRRLQRRNDFAREGLSMAVAEAVSLVATIAAALITRSFLAALFGLVARAIMLVVVSHLTAERAYEARYAREHVRRLAAFSAPLMLNGLLLFLAGQGDRLLVGSQLGVTALGRYSAVLLLVYYPSMMLMRYFNALQLPMVASARGTPATLRQAIDTLSSESMLLALAMTAGFALVAPLAVPLLFGRAFAQPATVIALIGVLQLCRFLRSWPVTAALATGRSKTVLTSNLARLIAFATALAGVRLVGGLSGLALGFALGELASVALAVALANSRLGLGVGFGMMKLVAYALACVLIVATAHFVDAANHRATLITALGTILVLASIMWRERETVRRFADGPLRLGMQLRGRSS